MGCVNSSLDQTCQSQVDNKTKWNSTRRKNFHSKQSAEKESHIQRLGLTNKQMYLLKSSWKAISAEMQANGISIFVDIFKSNKEVLNAFPKLNPNINSSAMKSPKDKAINEAFQEHGTKVEFK